MCTCSLFTTGSSQQQLSICISRGIIITARFKCQTEWGNRSTECPTVGALKWVPYSRCPTVGALQWVPYSGCPTVGALQWVPYSGCPTVGALQWVPYSGCPTVGAELNLHKVCGSMLIYAMGGPKTKLHIDSQSSSVHTKYDCQVLK